MMNVDEYKLPLKKVIEEFELEKIYETDDLDSVMITNTDVNRPGLQMVGFFDYFDNNRIQIMGKVEFTYLEQLHADERAEKIEKLMSQHIPALIVTRGLQILPEMIELAEKYNVPLLRSESGTSAFMSALIAYLNVQLAPRRTRHGVLVEVYGEGIHLFWVKAVSERVKRLSSLLKEVTDLLPMTRLKLREFRTRLWLARHLKLYVTLLNCAVSVLLT